MVPTGVNVAPPSVEISTDTGAAEAVLANVTLMLTVAVVSSVEQAVLATEAVVVKSVPAKQVVLAAEAVVVKSVPLSGWVTEAAPIQRDRQTATTANRIHVDFISFFLRSISFYRAF